MVTERSMGALQTCLSPLLSAGTRQSWRHSAQKDALARSSLMSLATPAMNVWNGEWLRICEGQ